MGVAGTRKYDHPPPPFFYTYILRYGIYYVQYYLFYINFLPILSFSVFCPLHNLNYLFIHLLDNDNMDNYTSGPCTIYFILYVTTMIRYSLYLYPIYLSSYLIGSLLRLILYII